jgi:CHASE3 domain sensor protein
MDTGESKQQQSPQQINFRRLIRYSFGAQVAVVAIVLSITLYGALQTTKSSDELKSTSTNVLLFRGVQQEFDRSRAALREYVLSENAFRLGPFTQSRGQIALIAATLGASLDQETKQRLNSYISNVNTYLSEVGDKAVALMKRDDSASAVILLNSKPTTDRLLGVTRQGAALQARFATLESEAEQAVASRQTTNVVLIVAAGILVLGAGFGLLLWIRREMMLPLDDLAMASRKLGHGDLTARRLTRWPTRSNSMSGNCTISPSRAVASFHRFHMSSEHRSPHYAGTSSYWCRAKPANSKRIKSITWR